MRLRDEVTKWRGDERTERPSEKATVRTKRRGDEMTERLRDEKTKCYNA